MANQSTKPERNKLFSYLLLLSSMILTFTQIVLEVFVNPAVQRPVPVGVFLVIITTLLYTLPELGFILFIKNGYGKEKDRLYFVLSAALHLFCFILIISTNTDMIMDSLSFESGVPEFVLSLSLILSVSFPVIMALVYFTKRCLPFLMVINAITIIVYAALLGMQIFSGKEVLNCISYILLYSAYFIFLPKAVSHDYTAL